MILVTGGTGFIGSHLLERLSSQHESVRCLVRPKAVPRSLPSGFEIAYGDLSSGAGVEQALAGVHTVIHLAGVTKALRTEDYYTGNVHATENLLRALQARHVRLVHVSSLAAAGPGRGGEPVSEDTEPRPLTHYGKSKLQGERLVRELAPDAVIVRPPVVYGPRDADVFLVLRSISRGVVMQLSGGERWFSAIYVKDLIDGLLAAARSPRAPGRTYFLAHSKPVSWSQLGAAAAGIMRRQPRVLQVPMGLAKAAAYGAELWSRVRGKPGILSREKIAEAQCRSWICQTSRAGDELGFVAHTSLEAGLAETLAWYKEAGWLSY